MGLDDSFYTSEKLEFYGEVNFMKSGLLYSDIVNTVSETYVKEIKTPEYGERMNGLLKSKEDDLYGIVNGIDTVHYNPSTDPLIYKNYDSTTLHNKLINHLYR